MNTTNLVVGTGTIVLLGRWSEGKPLSINVVVGGAALAISLALMSEANEKLASYFGLAVLLAALFRFMPGIASKAGWTGELKKVGKL